MTRGRSSPRASELPAAALVAAAIALSAGCGGGSETTTATTGDRTASGDVGDGHGGVELTEIGEFDAPLYVTQPEGDGKDIYVVEQAGTVQRVAPDGTSRTFLDVSGEITSGGEQGLLSMAFAPDYADPASSTSTTPTATATPGWSSTGAERGRVDESDAPASVLADRSAVPEPQRRPARCSAPTASSTSALGDGGDADDPQPQRPDPRRCSARSCGSIRSRGRRRPTRCPRDNPFVGRGAAAGDLRPTGCATRGASRSTARPATSRSATSARTPSRRSTSSAAAGLRGELRVVGLRGRGSLQRATRTPTGRSRRCSRLSTRDGNCSITGGLRRPRPQPADALRPLPVRRPLRRGAAQLHAPPGASGDRRRRARPRRRPPRELRRGRRRQRLRGLESPGRSTGSITGALSDRARLACHRWAGIPGNRSLGSWRLSVGIRVAGGRSGGGRRRRRRCRRRTDAARQFRRPRRRRPPPRALQPRSAVRRRASRGHQDHSRRERSVGEAVPRHLRPRRVGRRSSRACCRSPSTPTTSATGGSTSTTRRRAATVEIVAVPRDGPHVRAAPIRTRANVLEIPHPHSARTTTAASSQFGPDGNLWHQRPATATAPATPRRTPRTATRCSASCCGSTRVRRRRLHRPARQPVRRRARRRRGLRLRFPQPVPLLDRPARQRHDRDRRRRPVPPGRRSTSPRWRTRAAPTSAGTPTRGHAAEPRAARARPTRRRRRPADLDLPGPRPTRTTRTIPTSSAAAPSSAASIVRDRRLTARCAAATSTPTTAAAAPRLHPGGDPPARRRRALRRRPGRRPRPSITTGRRERIYVTTRIGAVFRIDPANGWPRPGAGEAATG